MTFLVDMCCTFFRKFASTVTAQLMNGVLGNVLKLIRNNIGTADAPWMNRIASKSTGENFAHQVLSDVIKRNSRFAGMFQKVLLLKCSDPVIMSHFDP